MKHVHSNEPQTHDVLQDYIPTISSMWKLPEVKVKHCGLVQSEAGACDQENFVEN